MKKISFETTIEFDKDLKKLAKKYRTLHQDLEILKKATIDIYHNLHIDNQSIFPIPTFCNAEIHSYKIKKFASKSFKDKGVKTGLRLIYIFIEKTRQVILVEIYYKGDKSNEDYKRLKHYYQEANKNT